MQVVEALKPYQERYDAMVETANKTMEDLRISGHDEITISIPRKDLASCLLALGESYQIVGGSLATLLNFKDQAQGQEGVDLVIEKLDESLPQGLTKLDNILQACASIIANTQDVPDSVPDWLAGDSQS